MASVASVAATKPVRTPTSAIRVASTAGSHFTSSPRITNTPTGLAWTAISSPAPSVDSSFGGRSFPRTLATMMMVAPSAFSYGWLYTFVGRPSADIVSRASRSFIAPPRSSWFDCDPTRQCHSHPRPPNATMEVYDVRNAPPIPHPPPFPRNGRGHGGRRRSGPGVSCRVQFEGWHLAARLECASNFKLALLYGRWLHRRIPEQVRYHRRLQGGLRRQRGVVCRGQGTAVAQTGHRSRPRRADVIHGRPIARPRLAQRLQRGQHPEPQERAARSPRRRR